MHPSSVVLIHRVCHHGDTVATEAKHVMTLVVVDEHMPGLKLPRAYDLARSIVVIVGMRLGCRFSSTGPSCPGRVQTMVSSEKPADVMWAARQHCPWRSFPFGILMPYMAALPAQAAQAPGSNVPRNTVQFDSTSSTCLLLLRLIIKCQ